MSNEQPTLLSFPQLSKRPFNIVAEAADSLGIDCYVVGGYVRDLFLGRHSKDIDFVCVGPGSGIAVAEATAGRLGKGARVNVFRTYGTAQVTRGGMELEFVAARRESYNRDSRNPIVDQVRLMMIYRAAISL